MVSVRLVRARTALWLFERDSKYFTLANSLFLLTCSDLQIFVAALALFASVAIAQEFDGEFDPSGGQIPAAGMDQYGVQPDFNPEGAEQFEGGAEAYDAGYAGQQGPQQYDQIQPNFAEESVQRVHRILPAIRN